MFLLVAEGTALVERFGERTSCRNFFRAIFSTISSSPGRGSVLDLVQPFFMFIVGVAMPFSYAKRRKRGDSRQKITLHIIRRCVLLLAFGVGLHCGYSGKLVWELWNVLAQLLDNNYRLFSDALQAFSSNYCFLGFLLLTEIAYRTFPLEGFNQPFVKGHNFEPDGFGSHGENQRAQRLGGN